MSIVFRVLVFSYLHWILLIASFFEIAFFQLYGTTVFPRDLLYYVVVLQTPCFIIFVTLLVISSISLSVFNEMFNWIISFKLSM